MPGAEYCPAIAEHRADFLPRPDRCHVSLRLPQFGEPDGGEAASVRIQGDVRLALQELRWSNILLRNEINVLHLVGYMGAREDWASYSLWDLT